MGIVQGYCNHAARTDIPIPNRRPIIDIPVERTIDKTIIRITANQGNGSLYYPLLLSNEIVETESPTSSDSVSSNEARTESPSPKRRPITDIPVERTSDKTTTRRTANQGNGISSVGI